MTLDLPPSIHQIRLCGHNYTPALSGADEKYGTLDLKAMQRPFREQWACIQEVVIVNERTKCRHGSGTCTVTISSCEMALAESKASADVPTTAISSAPV